MFTSKRPRGLGRLVALLALLACDASSSDDQTYTWLITMSYSDEQCSAATTGSVSAMKTCTDEGLGVYVKKSCEDDGNQIVITTKTFSNKACSGSPGQTLPQVVPKGCNDGTTYECTTDSGVLEWPAVATYVSLDEDCGEWATSVTVFNPNCSSTNPYGASCSGKTMVYREYDNNCTVPKSADARYVTDSCRQSNVESASSYYATCNGVVTMPGVVAPNEEHEAKLKWWAILLIALGCFIVILCLLKSGTRQLTNFVASNSTTREGDRYRFLEDLEIDKLRGSEGSATSVNPDLTHLASYNPPALVVAESRATSADTGRPNSPNTYDDMTLRRVSAMLKGQQGSTGPQTT